MSFRLPPRDGDWDCLLAAPASLPGSPRDAPLASLLAEREFDLARVHRRRAGLDVGPRQRQGQVRRGRVAAVPDRHLNVHERQLDPPAARPAAAAAATIASRPRMVGYGAPGSIVTSSVKNDARRAASASFAQTIRRRGVYGIDDLVEPRRMRCSSLGKRVFQASHAATTANTASRIQTTFAPFVRFTRASARRSGPG